MKSQRRVEILTHLSSFGRGLEESWDCPRAVSLAGIAEHLGVVRSALHPPLRELEEGGLVFSRTAHVIGAPRRRKVYHVTDAGREEAAKSTPPEKKRRGRSVGPIPDKILLHGREDFVASLSSRLSDGSSILLEGLAGIGKTTVVVSTAECLLEDGYLVRFATCQADTDLRSIAGSWFGGRTPSTKDAIAARADSKKTLLVLDEAQQLSGRHSNSIQEMLEACSETSAAVLVVTRAPNPFTEMSGFESIRLEGLEPSMARPLLPEELDEEEAMEICLAMDGHPLGIKLWSPDDDLPGAGAVQEYVKSQVLSRLTQEGASSLDELSLSPLPLEVEEMLDADGCEYLDDAAILRWTGQHVEPHHLVRNVRRATLDDSRAASLHSRLAEMWAGRQGPRARRMEAHHRLESGSEVGADWIKATVSEIMADDTASAAVVLDRAIVSNPEEALFELATDMALQRGETKAASEYIESLPDGPRKDMAASRLARSEGDWEKADALESSAISRLDPTDRAKAEISALVRKYDDRIPGTEGKIEFEALLSEADSIDLSELATKDRELATLALDMLRYSLALEAGSMEEASRTRDSIEDKIGTDDPRIPSLNLMSRLSAGATGGEAFLHEALEDARLHISSTNDPFDRLRTIHMCLEASPDPPDWLVEAHSEFDHETLNESLPHHQRCIAHLWYWRGVREDRLSSWKEAIVRLRSCGSINAARELTARLSREL